MYFFILYDIASSSYKKKYKHFWHQLLFLSYLKNDNLFCFSNHIIETLIPRHYLYWTGGLKTNFTKITV